VLFGVICGCVGVYLSEWGLVGVPEVASKALEGLAVLSLIGTRAMPRATIDDRALRSSVGDASVNGLSALRGTAITVLILAVVPAVFITPLISDVPARRAVLICCATILVGAMATLALVEVRYRALISQAGLPMKTF
jgi:hypothetical protein